MRSDDLIASYQTNDRSAARPMRIAHLTTVDMSLTLLLKTELIVDVEAGHAVFGISASGRWAPQLEALGVKHVPIDELSRRWSLVKDLKAALRLWKVLSSLELDVLHTHNPKTGLMGRIIGRLQGVPIVVNTCHGLWATSEDALLKRCFVYLAEGIAAQFSDAELYQNPEDRDFLRHVVPTQRAKVVGNGIDLNHFSFDNEGRERVRSDWKIGQQEILVLGVGRKVESKGLAEFSEAAVALRGKARFVWVGPDDPEKADAIIGALPGVECVGERHDMVAVYSAADIFVLPSYREGFPRSAMEAAACGRPLILTDIRGCREIGTAELEVLFVPPRKGNELTAAIRRLVGSSSMRERLGLAAALRAQRAFDQRRIAARSLVTYGEIAARKGIE